MKASKENFLKAVGCTLSAFKIQPPLLRKANPTDVQCAFGTDI